METPCIIHPGAKTPGGYGVKWHKGKTRLAHRVAYAVANGLDWADIEGVVLMHSCDNPPCINPKHLKPGTHQTNVADKMRKGRHRARTWSPEQRAELGLKIKAAWARRKAET